MIIYLFYYVISNFYGRLMLMSRSQKQIMHMKNIKVNWMVVFIVTLTKCIVLVRRVCFADLFSFVAIPTIDFESPAVDVTSLICCNTLSYYWLLLRCVSYS